MTYYEPSRPAPFGAISVFRAVKAFEALYRAGRRWHVARATDSELRKLSDRQLEDLGITRGMIEDISTGFARGH